jgi:hypothetical protein
MSVVIARSYSRYSGSTRQDSETTAAGCSRRITCSSSRSCPDRGNAAIPQEPDRRDGGILVERPDLASGGVQPAADGTHQVGGHDPGRLHPEVGVAIAFGDGLAGYLQDRLVALGGDQPERAHGALQQLIGGDRGAVPDRLDRRRVGAEQLQRGGHARHEGERRVVRR